MGKSTRPPLRKRTYISSGFLDRRPPRTTPHQGTDWPGAPGEDVLAIANLVVTEVGYDETYGWYYKARTYRDRHRILVGHMMERPRVRKGSRPRKGWRTGRVGHTGAARGDHVHVSVWERQQNGTYKLIDPAKFLATH